MHCNACERAVVKVVSKIKGVEMFSTDMNQHKVVITGQIDPKKVLKKLRKKTGKRVEIIENNKEVQASKSDDDDHQTLESELIVAQEQNAYTHHYPSRFDYCCVNDEVLTMFSDENPNACSIA